MTREALGGYPAMPGGSEEDRVKGGDSDAFKRACVLFGIGEYLYGDDPPVMTPLSGSHDDRESAPPHTSRRPGTGRALYAWARDNDRLEAVLAYGRERGLPERIVQWSLAEAEDAFNAIYR